MQSFIPNVWKHHVRLDWKWLDLPIRAVNSPFKERLQRAYEMFHSYSQKIWSYINITDSRPTHRWSRFFFFFFFRHELRHHLPNYRKQNWSQSCGGIMWLWTCDLKSLYTWSAVYRPERKRDECKRGRRSADLISSQVLFGTDGSRKGSEVKFQSGPQWSHSRVYIRPQC